MTVTPIENGTLGFRFLLIGFMMLVFLLIRRQWRSASTRREEILRLVAFATEESYVTESEIRATEDSSYVTESEIRVRANTVEEDHGVVYRCAVCNYPTKTRCAQCKSVHYCSSKCQILHWRKGHKDECKSPFDYNEENSIKSDDTNGSHIEISSSETEEEEDSLNNNGVYVDVSRTKPSVHQKVETRSENVDFIKEDRFYETTRPVSRKKTRGDRTEKVESSSKMSSNGLKTSVQRVVQRFRPPKSSKLSQPSSSINEMSFSYEMFMKLYYDKVELQPFGLVNLGNSCYANAVLQCLAFTQPLMSYLIKGSHSKACKKKSWCLVCEFEHLLVRAREGESPLSPTKILSRLQKIGKHLGPGKQEDAHEFLRCAVDTMQSVFLKEASSFTEEKTTLIGFTFGGYLHSKIKCMKCLHKSERSELMMDLTVEIDGDIASLEEALTQFTSYEVLDKENRYFCSKCKSYQKAKKKLTILEGPNILTVVLKRFQSENFEKLSKPIYFPEVLDISPYMSKPKHKDDRHVYSLYAVVVHLDAMNSSISGHYVCYVKTFRGDWFKIDDDNVKPVRLETVLLQGAYMLLYARDSPRPVRKNDNGVSGGRKFKERRSLAAIPASKKQRESSSSNKSLMLPRVDWSSGSLSSMFSSSDTTSSCSTKDSSGGIENLSDYLFGEIEPVWH